MLHMYTQLSIPITLYDNCNGFFAEMFGDSCMYNYNSLIPRPHAWAPGNEAIITVAIALLQHVKSAWNILC